MLKFRIDFQNNHDFAGFLIHYTIFLFIFDQTNLVSDVWMYYVFHKFLSHYARNDFNWLFLYKYADLSISRYRFQSSRNFFKVRFVNDTFFFKTFFVYCFFVYCLIWITKRRIFMGVVLQSILQSFAIDLRDLKLAILTWKMKVIVAIKIGYINRCEVWIP